MEREGDRQAYLASPEMFQFSNLKHQTSSDSDFMRDSRSVLPTVVLLKFVTLR